MFNYVIPTESNRITRSLRQSKKKKFAQTTKPREGHSPRSSSDLRSRHKPSSADLTVNPTIKGSFLTAFFGRKKQAIALSHQKLGIRGRAAAACGRATSKRKQATNTDFPGARENSAHQFSKSEPGHHQKKSTYPQNQYFQ